MIALWVIGVIAVIITESIYKRWATLVREAVYTLLGALCIIIPILLYCILTHSLSDMIYGAFTFNIIYIKHEAKISLLKMLVFVTGTLFLYGAVFPQLYLIYKAYNNHAVRPVLSLLVATGLLNIVTIIMSQRTYSHYLITQIPVAVISIAICLSDTLSWLNKKYKWQTNVGLALVIWILIGIFGPIAGAIEFTHKLMKLSRTQNESNQERIISKYVKAHTTSADTIYEWRSDANIYNESDRFANSKYFTLPSITLANYPEIQKVLVSSFENNAPKYFITKPNFFTEQTHAYAETRIRNIIRERYQLTKVLKTDNTFQVYKLR